MSDVLTFAAMWAKFEDAKAKQEPIAFARVILDAENQPQYEAAGNPCNVTSTKKATTGK